MLPVLREEALKTPRPTTPRTTNRRPYTPAGRRPFTAAGPRPETATSLENPLLSQAEREAMGVRVKTARPHGRKVWEPKGTSALAAYGRAWPLEALTTWDLRAKFVPAAAGLRTGKWAAGGGGDAGGERSYTSRSEGWKDELASQVRTALKKGGSERKWWHEPGWATPVAPEEFTHRTSHASSDVGVGLAAAAFGKAWSEDAYPASGFGGSSSGGGGGTYGTEGLGDTGALAGGELDDHLRDHPPPVDLGFDPPEGELPIVLDDFDDDEDDLEVGSVAWGRDMH